MAPADRLRTLRKGALHISKRLVLSYVIDWILIMCVSSPYLASKLAPLCSMRCLS